MIVKTHTAICNNKKVSNDLDNGLLILYFVSCLNIGERNKKKN